MNMKMAFDLTLTLADKHREHRNPAPCPEMGMEHIWSMRYRFNDETMSEAKQGRWLGWVQAAVVVLHAPRVTLEDMKEINKSCS